MKAKDVIALAKEHKATMVDVKFMDLIGQWQHFTIPAARLSEDLFVDGLGFDGSSIRGWQSIHESDMLVIPDPASALMDPVITDTPTVSVIGNIFDPVTRQAYSRDPRNIGQKAEAYLKSTGLADTCFFGPEAEFFVFDDVRMEQTQNRGYYEVDSVEGAWNTAREEHRFDAAGNLVGGNLGHKPRIKGGYFPVPPVDSLQELRNQMVLRLMQAGIEVETHHHEVATGGQCEIDMRFGTLVKMADQLMWYKYIIKNVARENGRIVTFMPKPLFEDNGSGMHCHQSLWKGEKPLFAGDEYGGFSKMGLYYIGGLLKHAPALAGLTNPTTNSYRRLVPGFEAPVNLAYSSRNRSAAARIPMLSTSPKTKRVELRFPDPLCNPYLAFSAMMMAGLDGIQNKIDPGAPLDRDIYGMTAEELKEVPHLPGSLDESLNALERDHDFLLKGDVFTKDVIETWIEYKRENEVKVARMRPTPVEFLMYFDW